MNKPKLIAVPDAKVAGAIVWWTLEGEVRLDALKAAWAARGLDEVELPDEQTPTQALKHAIRELTEKRRLARPLEGRGQWALVTERAHDEELDYALNLRASADDDGIKIEPEGHPLAGTLRTAYAHNREVATSSELSRWLIGVARGRNAVGLRDTGGLYFVPAQELAGLRKRAEALHVVSSCRLYEVPALRSDEAVAAILDALAREAEAEAQAMAAEMDEDKAGPRRLRSRAARCEQILAQVESYAELLGANLGTLTQKIEELKGNLVAAALAAETERKWST